MRWGTCGHFGKGGSGFDHTKMEAGGDRLYYGWPTKYWNSREIYSQSMEFCCQTSCVFGTMMDTF